MKREKLFLGFAVGLVAIVVLLIGCATLPPAKPIKNFKSIAGTWKGTFTTDSHDDVPVTVTIRPDGTYKHVRAGRTSSGTFKLLKDGKVKSRTTTWTLHEGEGKRILTTSHPRGTGKYTKTVLSSSVVAKKPTQIVGPQAQTPLYKDGDWWKVKAELEFLEGLSRSGRCDEDYSEYLVKIQKGIPTVYGIEGTSQEEIECPLVEARLLGTGESAHQRLKFPLTLGKTWRVSYRRGRTEREQKVLAWEKIQTSKGEFDAFKISRERLGVYRPSVQTYYYAPKVKAIVLYQSEARNTRRKITLVDFNVK